MKEIQEIARSIDICGERIERIKERNRLHNESGLLNEQIDELRKKIKRLETKRIIVDSEIREITVYLDELAGDL